MIETVDWLPAVHDLLGDHLLLFVKFIIMRSCTEAAS